VHDRAAGGEQQGDLVRLALDPRLLDPHDRGAEPADRLVRPAELRERVVDDRLRDRHLVGTVLAQRQLDHAGLEHGPLDRQLLDRRPAAVAQAGPAEHGEQRHGTRDQQQRDEPEQPRRRRRDALAERGHETSKNPCQPSSVNSDWCAWNMNLPAVGKRHSAVPRWPWHSITVSVNSAAVGDVPVGYQSNRFPCRWNELIRSYSSTLTT